jgi:polysaccharide export outer membrane protein
MRMSLVSFLVLPVLALALGGCFSRTAHYAQDPSTPPIQAEPAGAQVPIIYAAPPATAYPAPVTLAPRGFFTAYAGGPFVRAPAYAPPAYAAYPQAVMQTPYLLDAGDRLRITVFGQDGLTNSYAVDAAGNITMPLVGSLPARGLTTAQLSLALTERLKHGYIREPKVAIEVEAYRPFFIHGEVAAPGQYAYVANLTVENAIAIAGGFGPRADRSQVTVSRTINGQTTRATVPLSYPLRPGDTLRIGERWF